MRLPDLVAYQAAIQHPSTAFADPQLRAATVATGQLGLPRAVAGNFAVTYQLRNGSHQWAVRCFHREAADRAPRYAAISQALAHFRDGPLVPIEYIDAGVRVGHAWYPVTKMPWIDGFPLNRTVESLLSKPTALQGLERRFVELVSELRRRGIAHGDLQHGNILVDGSGALRLVDYDGMFVSALRGRPASEAGDPNYQHPQRGSQFDAELDRFSAIVIVVALRALAAAPALWAKYNTGDNLLFRRSDFLDPSASPLFRDLAGVASVRELSERLARASREDHARIPSLNEVLKRPSRSIAQTVKPRPWRLRRTTVHQSIAFSADGLLVATADYNGKICVREVASGRTKRTVRMPQVAAAECSVAFARTGALMVAAVEGDIVTVWDVANFRRLHELSVGGRSHHRLALSSHGGWLAAGSSDGVVRCWSLANGRLTNALAQSGPVTAVAISADGRQLAAANPRGQVRVWQVPGAHPVGSLSAGRGVACVAFAQRASRLIVGTEDGEILQWDLSRNNEVQCLADLKEPLESVALSADGEYVCATGGDGSVWLRRVKPLRAREPLVLPRPSTGYRLLDWLRRLSASAL